MGLSVYMITILGIRLRDIAVCKSTCFKYRDKFITLFDAETKNLLYNLVLFISRALQCRKDLLTKVM